LGSSSGVELVQRLVGRQRRQLEPGGVAAALEHAELVLEQQVEELAVAERLLLGARESWSVESARP
jgi:hypothetical protein